MLSPEISGVKVSDGKTELIKDDFKRKTKHLKHGDSFLRKIRCTTSRNGGLSFLGLSDYLTITDQHLNIVAAQIGASVVRHDWCLVPAAQDPCPTLEKYFGIPGHILGAKIDYVEGVTLSAEKHGQEYWDFYEKLGTIAEELYRENGWYVEDACSPHQYMKTSEPETGTSQLILVDIETRVNDYL